MATTRPLTRIDELISPVSSHHCDIRHDNTGSTTARDGNDELHRSRMRFSGPSCSKGKILLLCHATPLQSHPHAVFGARQHEHDGDDAPRSTTAKACWATRRSAVREHRPGAAYFIMIKLRDRQQFASTVQGHDNPPAMATTSCTLAQQNDQDDPPKALNPRL